MATPVESPETHLERPGNSEQQSPSGWSALFNFTTRRHNPTLLLALIFSAASGVIVPILAVLFGKIFGSFTDYGAGTVDGKVLTHHITTYVIAVVALGGATWLSNGLYCTAWMAFGALQAQEIRDRLFEDLLHKEVEWYETHTSGIGALLPRLQTQIRDLQMATSQPIGFVAHNVVSTLASLGLAFYYSWRLTLVTMSTVPVAFLVLAVISATIQSHIEAENTDLTRAAKYAHVTINSSEVVKSFNAQEHEVNQYSGAVKSASISYLKQARFNAFQMGFVRFFTLAMFVQGFWYGHRLTAKDGLSTQDVTTTFWACLLAIKAFEDILPQALVLEKGRAAGAGLKTLLEKVKREPTERTSSGLKAPRFCDGDIEFKEVSFAYPSRPGHAVLKKSSFFFPAGETTFLVGRSGSGKSTIGNLLMRFHDPTAGGIFVDGINMAELDINWLRNNVTLIQQQSILFNESLLRNITFGKPDFAGVSDQEVQECIKLALLEDTIAQLPQGMHTVLGNLGVALSGGQRQRVAIARARLRNTPILILDESTSALDYINRTAVMAAIRKWRAGRTTIIITHEMSQINDADFVYVLQNGSVVQEGFRQHMEVASGAFRHLIGIREGDETDPRMTAGRSLTRQDHSSQGAAISSSSLLRQSSAFQQDKQASVFEMVNSQPLRRASAVVYNFPDDGLTRRSPSPYSRTPEVNKALQIPSGSRPLSTFSFLAGPTDLRALELQGMSSQVTRPVSMHGLAGTREDHHSAMSRLRIRRLATRKKALRQRGSSDPASDIPKESTSVLLILSTIWPTLTAPYRLLLVLALSAALTNAAGPPVFSLIFSRLMMTFFHPKEETHKALIYSLAILGVAIVDGCGCYIMHYLFEGCGQVWVDTLRIEALRRIINQPKEWFEDDKNGMNTLSACLDRNANEMRNLLGRFAGLLFIATVMVFIAVVWSLAVCWKLTLVAIAAISVMYGVTKAFESVTARWESLTNDAVDVCGGILMDTFSDIKTVRSLTLEAYFHKKYRVATAKALSVGIKRAIYCGFLFGAAESAIHFVTALIFWYGARIVAAGDFSITSILTVFSMILFSAANANAVLLFIPQIRSSVETATQLLSLAHLPSQKSHEYVGDRSFPATHQADIQFNDLTFSYPTRPGVAALDRLSLHVPSGKCTAIVGQSGSGKSTIAALLLRFYPCPQHGQTSCPPLTIAGFPITSLSTPSLRESIALVPQTPTLFPTTVSANITYGLPLTSPHTTMLSIEAAAKAAGIHDFITTLPQGYNTIISDTSGGGGGGGIGLSGGQAQRLVIARALVRNPRILILDESTSALDHESASQIRDTVRNLVSENQHASPHPHPHLQQQQQQQRHQRQYPMTVILITHSKDMMTLGDKIAVMKNGRCVEQGTFEELRRKRTTADGDGDGDGAGELARILRAAGGGERGRGGRGGG